jgi:hypothetical protein
LAFIAVFLGILYIFFSAGGASAAVTVVDSEHVTKAKELSKKNVNYSDNRADWRRQGYGEYNQDGTRIPDALSTR